MSSEIDLSFFLATLRRRWWIVVLCTALAVAIGLGIGLSQDRRYEAVNTLLVQSPRYQWRFINEIVTITDQRRDFQREVLAIARSDEMAETAAIALEGESLEEPVNPQALQSAIAVRAGDGNTIIVTATADDPEQAAAYARAWTATLIGAAREVYGSIADLATFQAQLRDLEADMLEMEAALAETRSRTGIYAHTAIPDEIAQPSINLQHLNQVTEILADYLVDLNNIRLVQGKLVEATDGTDLAQLPWELLAGPVLSQRGVISPEIARANLDTPATLLDLLREEENALQATADALEEQAAQLRDTLATDWYDFEKIQRERNQARDLYQIMFRKVGELLLQERLDPSLLTIVGSPEPLVAHVRAPMLGLLASAAVAGLIVGVFLAVWLELSSRKQAPPPAPALQ
jgi:uncharacterized protein involved in exopolysaccharide biosynthesis